MNELSLLYDSLIVGGLLFVIGLIGFLVRRNMIVMFLCVEMMLQGVAVCLVGFGRYHGTLGTPTAWDGQTLVIFMITVAACEAGIAMALILMLAQRTGSLDALIWQDLREEGQPAFVDQRVPEELVEDQVWPTLTPAGREPLPNIDEQQHRSRV
ncbi:NADH-quinone oxidoreductase subunit K [Anatilimnocola aggregata]|uniref:NADH-quinone oxidoreductase subunit K n=1 Tax=Anatilimnocola aggregata TaxID=2528021 RepID=A0A517YA44_9BACT|nr:NADH-quinone oxidoreductase subunit NuoK [Anatilimnocola aggregata]QDU27105.1 NADH-quinone oxidoreductase subunit K [Anatilimnocola aggregata]